MVEVHPFGDFVPKSVKYLMLGSFVTKPSNPYQWFYANGRNQFWPIMQEVYGKDFGTTEKQKQLFTDLEMALSDIIYSCERKRNSNLDVNLYNIVYNIVPIREIISKNRITKIYFSSRNVEDKFNRLLKNIVGVGDNVELVCLPSPSPRYAAMTRQQKIIKYRELLPKLS